MNSTVCLIPIDNYDEENVYQAVKQGFDMLGGPLQFVRKSEGILVKPNLLNGFPPEKAVTTHPAVFGAVLRCLREAGCYDLRYGDGPGIAANDPDNVVDVTGIRAMGQKYAAKYLDFKEADEVDYFPGKVARKFNLAKDVVDADAIISVCKMKTHALENITGALKNQYGCVHSSSKGMGHARYPNSRLFADMIVDLNCYLMPRFYVMDGIVAMEGNGPASGDPVNMNVILMSKDPVALDSVFARLVYLLPQNVPTCVSGYAAGLGTIREDEITVRTPSETMNMTKAAKLYGKPDFKVSRDTAKFWDLSAAFATIRPWFQKPVIDKKRCVGCGVCVRSCPAAGKAVHVGLNNKAKIDYKKCIRCYCCQEGCPAKAIKRKSFL